MQYRASSTTYSSTGSRWKGFFTGALKKAALQLQKTTNKWSKKTRLVSLLLFLTFSGGASLFILFASFSRKEVSDISVTPIRFPGNINRPDKRFNHWDGTQKTTGTTSLKDTTSEWQPLTNAVPEGSAFQPK